VARGPCRLRISPSTSLPFLTAVRRMQTRDPTVKVLFALWSLAMVVTVILAAAAAVYELPKITYYLVEEQNCGPASLYRYVGAFENYSDCVSARHGRPPNFSCVANGPPGQET
jgi:hypothetical protein